MHRKVVRKFKSLHVLEPAQLLKSPGTVHLRSLSYVLILNVFLSPLLSVNGLRIGRKRRGISTHLSACFWTSERLKEDEKKDWGGRLNLSRGLLIFLVLGEVLYNVYVSSRLRREGEDLGWNPGLIKVKGNFVIGFNGARISSLEQGLFKKFSLVVKPAHNKSDIFKDLEILKNSSACMLFCFEFLRWDTTFYRWNNAVVAWYCDPVSKSNSHCLQRNYIHWRAAELVPWWSPC